MNEIQPEDKQRLVEQVCETCQVPEQIATHYLEAYSWDTEAAIGGFMADNFDGAEQVADEAAEEAAEAQYTGPRTLDGRPAPTASRQSPIARSQKQPLAKKKGVATLSSLAQASNFDDDDDNSDNEDDKENRGNLFAGGEKSGLAVQDPSKEGGPRSVINDILAKGRANASLAEGSEAGPSTSSRFRGTGMTLGGEGQESRAIPDTSSLAPGAGAPVQKRVLHIWKNGFSIDDGELLRYDDPANQAALEMIRQERAPLHLMNVQYDQPIDIRALNHDTDYVAPPKKQTSFMGSGQRLGGIVPGAGSSASTAEAAPAPRTTSTSASGSAASSSAFTGPTVADSQPIVTIRIQLPDGRRVPVQFNTSHTVGDVYKVLQDAHMELLSSRPWVLATTFPNKDHTDKSLALANAPEFKKGGTAVVKWAN
ncbi:hypothetical protein CDD82_3174 [Ophiocordyceps australis]|uniref:UBX domain-containing protein n=1 Tax=Ophiocordyceps australis TaxID=1399860 RepID=A0A2C5XR52_9HYPO|nr:hypothetical protein CDD82_3174 [Ophiocordyceps australis]